jgi:hypothetical protein
MAKKRKRLYEFERSGERCGVAEVCACVSEVKLPPRSKRFKGVYGSRWGPLPRRARKVGNVVDLIFGCTFVLRGCRILSLRENPVPTDAPLSVFDRFVFEYRGKRMWGIWLYFALLPDVVQLLKKNPEWWPNPPVVHRIGPRIVRC